MSTTITDAQRAEEYREVERTIERRRNPREPYDVWTLARRALARLGDFPPPLDNAEIPCPDCVAGKVTTQEVVNFSDAPYGDVTRVCERCKGNGYLTAVQCLTCLGTDDECTCQ